MYRLYLSLGIAYVVYKYRMPIILNLNFWYRKLSKKISNRKIVTNKKITNITSKVKNCEITMYEYRFDNHDYITFDKTNLNIDIDNYDSFKNKLTKNSPNDIIMAELSYISFFSTDTEKVVDVLEDIRKLFGPFLLELDHSSIVDYFMHKIDDIKHMKQISIMYSDGEEKIYDFQLKDDKQDGNYAEVNQTICI